MTKDLEVRKIQYAFTVMVIFLSFYLISGCSGGNDTGDGGDGSGNRTRIVRGRISPSIASENTFATVEEETFTVRAVARDGSFHDVDTHPATGDFEMDLPVEECYTMSFIAHTGPEMMDEFLDFMVLDCGPEHVGEFDDQFCLSDGNEPIDLGTITVNPDHSFASPMHNPLEDVDFDGDGITDFHDSDYVCGNVEDDNHDGYYDDDMDHDGFHDDDMNFDGFHDEDMNHDGFHDGGDMDRDDFNHDDESGEGGIM